MCPLSIGVSVLPNSSDTKDKTVEFGIFYNNKLTAVLVETEIRGRIDL